MKKGVYTATKKDGTLYYRSSITFQNKHISLGSFSSEDLAATAYLEAENLSVRMSSHWTALRKTVPSLLPNGCAC